MDREKSIRNMTIVTVRYCAQAACTVKSLVEATRHSLNEPLKSFSIRLCLW